MSAVPGLPPAWPRRRRAAGFARGSASASAVAIPVHARKRAEQRALACGRLRHLPGMMLHIPAEAPRNRGAAEIIWRAIHCAYEFAAGTDATRTARAAGKVGPLARRLLEQARVRPELSPGPLPTSMTALSETCRSHDQTNG